MTSKNGLDLVFDQAQRLLLQIGSIVELLSGVRTRASTRNLNRRYNVRRMRRGRWHYSFAPAHSTGPQSAEHDWRNAERAVEIDADCSAPYKSAADDTSVRNYTSEQASRYSEDNNNTQICDVEMMAVDRASEIASIKFRRNKVGIELDSRRKLPQADRPSWKAAGSTIARKRFAIALVLFVLGETVCYVGHRKLNITVPNRHIPAP
ncbi:hypothetical protein B0H14DRAFT_3128741, partial [Mycena olivaceomarginata]